MKRRMAAISAFYKFLRKKKLIKENPTEFMDRPKKGMPVTVQTYLTPEQVDLMRTKLTEYGDLQLKRYSITYIYYVWVIYNGKSKRYC